MEAILSAAFAFDAWTLALFVGACAILFVTPGPNMMFAVACGLAGGPRAGFAAAAGAAAGLVAHTVLVAAGLAAALTASPAAFDVIRYVGAAYLLWLAWTAWRAGDDLENRLGRAAMWRAFRRGFLTCMLNPKAALFMLALLPQFADPAAAAPIWAQLTVLGVIAAILALVFDGAYGVFSGMIARRLRRLSRALNRISAIVFGGLAVRILAE